MNILKKSLSFFAEFDDNTSLVKPVVRDEITDAIHPPVPIRVSAQVEEHFDSLLQEANDSNFPGSDFYEFWGSVKLLSEAIPDEKVRYITAYNQEKKRDKGVTKQKLVTTADAYVKVLDQEVSSHLSQLDQLRKRDVDDKMKEADSLQKQADEMFARAQEFKTQAELLRVEANKSKAEMEDTVSIVKATQQSFTQRINEEINKINNFLT